MATKRNRAEGLQVSYADFLRICHVETPDDWMPGIRVAFDGVWLMNPEGPPLLSCQEASALSEHPDGDPSKPILSFPCTLGEIWARLEAVVGAGFIDPYELADFVASKSAESTQPVSKASASQLERHASTQADTLRAVLAVLYHFPQPKKLSAAKLARLVEEKAGLFWPEDGEPPLGRRVLTDLISKAIRLPKK